jgi:hypothetical protein
MPADNPFVYGEIVPGPRSSTGVELDRLIADLGDCRRSSDLAARYGKSSLVRQALTALARDRVVTLEITVSSFSSYVAFLEGYTRALAALDTRTGRARSWLHDMFSGAKPELRVDAEGPRLSVAFPSVRTARDAARLAEEVFVLPSRIAARLKRPLAIAFDEFQAIGSFNGGSVEQALRAAVQQQRQVGYVFAGSEPTLMEQMIGPRRPFYKAGPVMRLGKIPADVFAAFVEDRFRRSGLSPEAGLGAAIVDLAGNLPYDVQRLAHETWDDVQRGRRKTAGLEDLHETLHRLLAEHETFFETLAAAHRATRRARAVGIEHGVDSRATRAAAIAPASPRACRPPSATVETGHHRARDDGRYASSSTRSAEQARKTFLILCRTCLCSRRVRP